MSKRKKHLLKLTDKLKKIYFKKAIKIISNKVNVNFAYNRPVSPDVETTKKSIVAGKSYRLNFNQKYNLPLLNVLSNDFKNTVETKNYLKISKLLDSPNKKQLKYTPFSKLNQENYSKNKSKSNSGSTLKLIKSAETMIPAMYDLNHEPLIKGKSTKLSKIAKTNLLNTHKLKIKYVENPKDFAKIPEKSIANLDSEIDLKNIVAPSKKQMLGIQRQLKYGKTNRQRKFIKINKAINIDSGKTVIPKLSSDKILYAIPGFEEGTGGPLEKDVIGKIHKNETILNKSETRKLFQPYKLMSKKEPPNLKYMERAYTDQKIGLDDVSEMQIKSKNMKEQSIIEKVDEKTKTVEVTQKDFRDGQLFKNANMQQDRILTNLNKGLLHNDVLKKDKMPPNWRASLG